MENSLTHDEKVAAFKAATRSLIHWYGDELANGVTDERLEELLYAALGTAGGSGGPDRIGVAFQGAGLKIWAGRDFPNTVTDKPIFKGAATVRMAREVYEIADPSDAQMRLL